MASLNDIKTSIIAGSFTDAELTSIGDAIRFARSQLTKRATGSLVVGTKVKFTSSRTGGTVIGTVQKVNRKFIIVRDGMMNWRVPGNMLTVA